MDVDIFVPCFIDQLYPTTGINLVKVLRKAGCMVHYNENQTCCGQPAYNSGLTEQSKAVAEKFINDFDTNRPIIVPSASCVAYVKNHYKKLFADSTNLGTIKRLEQNIIEVSDFLVNQLQVTQLGASLFGKATFHDSCSGLREYGLKNEARLLLQHVEGLELVEMAEHETCCGFGGTFALKYPDISTGVADTKIENILDTTAEYLISTDTSCLLHLQKRMEKTGGNYPKSLHLVDVLASKT